MPKELTEQHKLAMLNGRRKAGEKKRKEAISRVLTWRAWNRDDAENGAPGRRKPMPTVPSDGDFEIARAEGAIQ